MTVLFPSRGFRRTRERASGLLFALGVDDLNPDLPSGQTLSLTRATGRTVLDATGRVASLAHSQMPWSMAYNSTESVWEPVLDVGNTTTNLCLQSENFGTTWAAVGTPTRTAAAATCGDLSLDLIGDDASGTLEGYTQTVGFSGNAVKAVSLFLKAGTSTSTVVRVRDTTASANRLLATIAWASGVPTVTMTTGTCYNTVACANGAYRLLFQTTTATAANTNKLEVYPATTSALATTNTGTVYAGGAQCENAFWCHAYAKTTTATVTVNQDQPTTGVNWAPQDFTLYARLQRPLWADLSGTIDNAYIAGCYGGAGAGFFVNYIGSARTVQAQLIDDTDTGVTASASIPATDFFDFAAKFSNVGTAGVVRIDVGSGYGTASATGGACASTWSASTMQIGHFNSVSYALDAGLRRLLIASGARTLAEMRGLAV